jgi:dihydrodipicolinate synthase/N-acetylneuraminate lyase
MTDIKQFHGLICPMLTPFDSLGRIDETTTRLLVDYLIDHGVNCLLPGGTTGEGMLLNLEERKKLAQIVVEQTAGRINVMVHTGCITTAETIELTLHARSIGADGVSVITPYFYSYDDDALFIHYFEIAKSVPNMSVALYSFPGNTKQEISINLFKRLRLAATNINAIKLSDVNLIRFQEYVQVGGDNFSALCGIDALALPALSIGAKGQVSGNSNVFPEPFCKLRDAFNRGDLEEARQQQIIINNIRAVLKDNPVYFKAAMHLRGIPMNGPRLPIRPLKPQEINEMEAGLQNLGLDVR